MKHSIYEAAAYFLAILARLLTPAIQRQLARICTRMVGDVADLESTWLVTFTEPSPKGKVRTQAIDATILQFGRLIRGTGHIHGEPGDPFEYQGIVKRNVFYGTFRRKDSHVLAGTGSFVLKINADSREMTGRCTWYDNLLDDVWTSKYRWKRKA
ncbi:MAG: hypothetical protein AMXMBFR84_42410 [Candidatus Hydrogenedentota bacterium]